MFKKLLAVVLVLVSLFANGISHVLAAPIYYTGVYTHGLVITQSNVIVDGADISNDGTGPGLKVTGDNVIIRNTKVHDTQDHGILLLGVNGALVENNTVWQTAMRNPPNTINGGWPSQIKVQSVDETPEGLSQNIVIRGNFVHHGYGEGMGLRGSYITVEGNIVQDNYSVGIYSNSDHTTIRGNFVLCTGDPAYNRDGMPMSGIGFAEEVFSKWGAHGHDSQVVINNVVEGCKYGFRYGASSNGMGLADTVVAFNTFSNIKASSVSITYYKSQSNVTVQNNLVSSVLSMKNVLGDGNVKYLFQAGSKAEDYRLQSPIPAAGPYIVPFDYAGTVRTDSLDAGAWEFYDGTIPPTLTQIPVTPTLTPTPTRTATPTVVPTDAYECILFVEHDQIVCLP